MLCCWKQFCVALVSGCSLCWVCGVLLYQGVATSSVVALVAKVACLWCVCGKGLQGAVGVKVAWWGWDGVEACGMCGGEGTGQPAPLVVKLMGLMGWKMMQVGVGEKVSSVPCCSSPPRTIRPPHQAHRPPAALMGVRGGQLAHALGRVELASW